MAVRVLGCRVSLNSFQVPGLKNECHSFWLFPIMVAQPKQVCDMMRAQNFDVTTGTTQLGSIDAFVPSVNYLRIGGMCCFVTQVCHGRYVSDQSGPFQRGSTRRAAALMQRCVPHTLHVPNAFHSPVLHTYQCCLPAGHTWVGQGLPQSHGECCASRGGACQQVVVCGATLGTVHIGSSRR